MYKYNHGEVKRKALGEYGAMTNWRLQGRGSWRIMKTGRNKIFRVFMRHNRFVRFAGGASSLGGRKTG
jgi:hypothetical protein